MVVADVAAIAHGCLPAAPLTAVTAAGLPVLPLLIVPLVLPL